MIVLQEDLIIQEINLFQEDMDMHLVDMNIISL